MLEGVAMERPSEGSFWTDGMVEWVGWVGSLHCDGCGGGGRERNGCASVQLNVDPWNGRKLN
jgi:hypothetical protein